MKTLDLSTTSWRKSSRSTNTGGACVEVTTLWRKSSRSTDTGGQCVEVASLPSMAIARDADSPKRV